VGVGWVFWGGVVGCGVGGVVGLCWGGWGVGCWWGVLSWVVGVGDWFGLGDVICRFGWCVCVFLVDFLEGVGAFGWFGFFVVWMCRSGV